MVNVPARYCSVREALSTCFSSSFTPIPAHICCNAVAMLVSSWLPASTSIEVENPSANPASAISALAFSRS